MKSFAVCLISLLASVSAASAEEPTVLGQVRLVDGSAVAGAQVMLFDVSDLRRGCVGAGDDGCGWAVCAAVEVIGSADSLCAGAELSESV